ncbi:membrane protein YqaA with SNARE-associated domain [Bradyrhizobium sp. LM6.10]
MTSFLDPLISFVSAHAWLAYLTLFLAALLEAVPVVGSVIPGSTIILALSALVPGGELKLQWVLLAAAIGAVLGDGSAYWIGHRRQREILNTWPLTNYPRVIEQSENFFRRFGAWAVFLASLRAADPGLCAGHRRRAGHAPGPLLRHQHPGDPGLGARACAAGCFGGVGSARICRAAASRASI